MNKKYMFGLMALFAVSIVAAGYLVNSFAITTDVYEPFEVEYAILGDAGNWDGEETCAEYDGDWSEGTDVDVGGLYAGEDRKVCVKINNLGEGDVDYTFAGEVAEGNGNYDECDAAFGSPSVSGTASGADTTYNGIEVLVADGAEPVDDCEIEVSLIRG